MTEIKIEKKPVWPWALLTLVAVAVLVYVLAARETPVTQTQPKTASLIDVRENNATVEAYVRFVEVDSREMGLDHVYTNAALTKLIEATNAMAGEANVDVQADLGKAKQQAESITVDRFSTSHADSIKSTTETLSNALQKIQQEKYPELASEITELKSASVAIKPGVLTLDQKEQIKGFFGKAAEVLKKMN